MKYLSLTILLICSLSAFAQDNELPPYLDQHKEIAIQEMNRSGIPASIILAQAIVESAWGKATLAQAANNHFGIKCKSHWTGPSYQLEDDDFDAEGNLIQSCFRAYPDVLSSFRDHSNFLMEGKRYQGLFELEKSDYKAWAHGLKACGYATDPAYAEKLISKIEAYGLDRFDASEAQVVMPAPSFEIPYHSTAEIEPVEQSTPESYMIASEFGLIETKSFEETETKPEEILEVPIYVIPAAVIHEKD